MRYYGYLWLAPDLKAEAAEQICQQRETDLKAHLASHSADWHELLVDRSLETDPAHRPHLQALLKQLKQDDTLIVYSLLDLGRRFHDVYALLDWFRQSPQGCFLALKEDLSVSRHQQSELLLTLSRIPQLQAPSDQPTDSESYTRSDLSRQNGGACPYGYQVNSHSNQYELIPEEARIVRQIFKQRARGHSLRQIVRDLTHQGVTTKRGGRWHANTIKSILENPFYTGCYQTHYTSFEQHHPPIISSDLYYQLNAHLLCDDIAM